MKYLLTGVITAVCIQAAGAQAVEKFLKPSLNRASYYPGAGDYLVTTTYKSISILDVANETVHNANNASECGICFPQVYHNGFILLDNSKGMQAYLHAPDGTLREKKTLTTDNDNRERYNRGIPSENGKYALFIGTRPLPNPDNESPVLQMRNAQGINFSYSAISADGDLLWYLKKKDLEDEMQGASVSAAAIDDDGTAHFVLELTKDQHTIFAVRVDASGKKTVKSWSLEKSGTVLDRSGITITGENQVLVYGNYYHTKADVTDKHGFYYAEISFTDETAPEAEYYTYTQNGKYDFVGKKLYGYPAENGGFYFVHEVIWKTRGAGDDEPKVYVLRLDSKGQLEKEASYDIVLYEGKAMEIINAVQMGRDKIFISYFPAKSKGDKKIKLSYTIFNEDLEAEKTGVLAEVGWAAISQWNCDVRRWGNYAIIEGAGFNAIYDKVKVN